MAQGHVRPGRPGDAGEIARIQVATWRTAYRRLFPRHVLADLDETEFAATWRDSIMAPPTGRHRVLVAVEQSSTSSYVVGFIAFGPSDDLSTAAEIGELLVEPRWGRRGHGSRLLAAAADHWRDDGFTSALAWVFDQAPATPKFLASAGWAPDGARRSLDVEDMLVPQSRYATLL
ncbi:GNAT superfamily N-acetyltransferase [Hamadaea flava]|uniref:GNAT family N-acetyltransferase n=1 Tax=Hamadaea flava TaxID=1742688 RepID=A0ABV8LJ41_9ACTN|nr:GNAT family N-acetyltransferase [Hamadaea flava]MCP2324848.1 GNAT superfamily N-acetyltransferase [Hamadaea flava]